MWTSPFGAVVHGLPNLAGHRPTARVLACLADAAAEHGYPVFRNRSLPGMALRAVSEYFGGLAAERTPRRCRALRFLRLSNREEHGVVRVGPQWHADGSFERRVFSHVLFHAQAVPRVGGGTEMSHLAAAFDALPAAQREAAGRAWSRLATVNAYSGAVHPLVHLHPRTGHRTLFAMDPAVAPSAAFGHRLLRRRSLRRLARQLEALLSSAAPAPQLPSLDERAPPHA
ncbi:hypothetical protein EMIHUDRAFT_231530 [Emiliania huxleyi CCMP1516]|uniref:TauD/TfdA-like domain-containing protein n=2 Tax=Emiliania huxleyi TaxID=2903 RepID=A0A0D3K7H5_EMIH1|nr:hypothetical protein EMIHUDRAFT_231530 [Emiliania huxleyi CCMP1516]EOD31710.1 hypothetical protein EMIHUDRAFT_231530 [Emiliania huxleyi CCMP1516]|eukprot:XP_005784139.1 hypothetical protein EMIHUDRAFT_231530 [Emiliania huxleyi CCMP1516]